MTSKASTLTLKSVAAAFLVSVHSILTVWVPAASVPVSHASFFQTVSAL